MPSSTPPALAEALPSSRPTGPLSLEEALTARRSIRSLAPQPLTRAEIGQLLWAAQGVSDAEGRRTTPSPSGTHPLELDTVTAGGVARYDAQGHSLLLRLEGDLRAELRSAAHDQPVVGEAAVVIAISAVFARVGERFGDRAERFAVLEAGHAAQNVLLEAVSLGLGAVPLGSFEPDAVAAVLRLGDGESPVYLIAIGHPR